MSAFTILSSLILRISMILSSTLISKSKTKGDRRISKISSCNHAGNLAAVDQVIDYD